MPTPYHLESLPGVDIVTACSLIANIGNINRFSSADKLASFAGVAPKNNSSQEKGTMSKTSHRGNGNCIIRYFSLPSNRFIRPQRENPEIRHYEPILTIKPRMERQRYRDFSAS